MTFTFTERPIHRVAKNPDGTKRLTTIYERTGLLGDMPDDMQPFAFILTATLNVQTPNGAQAFNKQEVVELNVAPDDLDGAFLMAEEIHKTRGPKLLKVLENEVRQMMGMGVQAAPVLLDHHGHAANGHNRFNAMRGAR